MTRLTPDLIEGVPDDTIALDSILKKYTGMDMRSLALHAGDRCSSSTTSARSAPCTP